jgi:flagellar protein FliO/FliZ
MKNRVHVLAVTLYLLPVVALAAANTSGSAVISPSAGLVKMLLGLGIVLAVIALVAWLAKRLLPSLGGQQSVLRVVSSVSVGSRERVVVVEVGDRWLVLGVAAGQVRPIANMEIGSPLDPISHNNKLPQPQGVLGQALVPPFAQWLKKSVAKFSDTPAKTYQAASTTLQAEVNHDAK